MSEYFLTYQEKGYYGSYNIGSDSGYKEIRNEFTNKHPLIWLQAKKQSIEKAIKMHPSDISYLKTITLLNWKELTDKEIELLEL